MAISNGLALVITWPPAALGYTLFREVLAAGMKRVDGVTTFSRLLAYLQYITVRQLIRISLAWGLKL